MKNEKLLFIGEFIKRMALKAYAWLVICIPPFV